jgi:hypothetical protein
MHKDYRIGELEKWNAQRKSRLGEALPTFPVKFEYPYIEILKGSDDGA